MFSELPKKSKLYYTASAKLIGESIREIFLRLLSLKEGPREKLNYEFVQNVLLRYKEKTRSLYYVKSKGAINGIRLQKYAVHSFYRILESTGCLERHQSLKY